MKTTKSILVVLFALLTTQIACAYYCPATGRWLSRDPNGEVGFQVIQATAIAPDFSASSSKWIVRDSFPVENSSEPDFYCFVNNDGVGGYDFLGLKSRCNNDTDCLCCLLFHEGRGQNIKCLAALRDAIVNKAKLNNRNICSMAVGGSYSGASDSNANPSGNYKKCCDQSWCPDVTTDKNGNPIKPYNPDTEDMSKIDAFMNGNNVLMSGNGEITRFLTAGFPKPTDWGNDFVQVPVPGCSAFTFWKKVPKPPKTKHSSQ